MFVKNILEKSIINRCRAFTLAEVLITLAVIGIVAAMAVPSLQTKISDKENIVALKKIYSELSDAANLIKIENGNTLKDLFTGSDNIVKGVTARNLFAAKMNNAKVCNATEGAGCWHQSGVMKYYSGDSAISWLPSNGSAIITSSGMLVMFYHFYNTDCSSGNVMSDTISDNGVCGSILVDVNGYKKPNRIGHDIFDLIVYPEGIKPNGNGTKSDCESHSYTCSAYFLTQ